MRWGRSCSEGQGGWSDRHVLQPHEPIEGGAVQLRIAAITRRRPPRYSVTVVSMVSSEAVDAKFGTFARAYAANLIRFA